VARFLSLSTRPPLYLLAVVLAAGLAAATPVLAAPPVVGSPNTATADPPVPRPATTPCTVPLYTNFQFANFDPKPFTFTPPAGCPGPWAKVVLAADFACTAGRQFDRTAEIAVGHVNVYFGTTSEPSAAVSPNWHVERDLTDYSPLFRTQQSGEVRLDNLVNGTFTGVLSGSAVLQFYPLAPHQQAPRTADLVLPFTTNPGGAADLAVATSTLAPTFNLPANVEAAYLDVIPQSQASDEFWYTCVPDDVAGTLQSCPSTAFREVEVTVDGQPAGVAPVYPWIFTGGIDPLLWRPIPGVQTLNFQPYRVNLTPFAGVLSDGHPHQVGLSVFNAHNHFAVAATLLVYRDAGSAQVTGAVTRNTLAAAPSPHIDEHVTTAADGSISATVNTKSERELRIEGFVNTSHGRVETEVRQSLDFSNRQRFTITDTQYHQTIVQRTRIESETETHGGHDSRHTETSFSFPLDLDFNFVVNADGSFAQTTAIDESFDSQVDREGDKRKDGGDGDHGDDHGDGAERVSNHNTTMDTLLFSPAGAVTGFQNRKSNQTYSSQTREGGCYSRSLTAENGLLTAIVDGQGCDDHHGDDEGGHGHH
jgi:hypothetical protein